MPSPFPGMDPYLEDPALWPNVHSTLIGVTRDLLSRTLRPRYFVGVEERLYITAEDDPGRDVIVPDLYVKPLPGASPNPWPPDGPVAIAIAQPIEVTLLDPEVHELRVEIVDTYNHAVVTVIEFVSPSNKVMGSEARRSYIAKRDQVYESPAHWVEIDLLRAGQTTFNRWAGTSSDYGVHLSRRTDVNHRRSLVWLIRLRQQLPKIIIPVKATDEDVTLDLQEVLTLAYERGNYDLVMNYDDEPRVPLADDADRWARELLARRPGR